MVGDTKAQKASETLRRYCAERGCNAECIFYSRISATCKLKVKAPDCFPAQQKKFLASSKVLNELKKEDG